MTATPLADSDNPPVRWGGRLLIRGSQTIGLWTRATVTIGLCGIGSLSVRAQPAPPPHQPPIPPYDVGAPRVGWEPGAVPASEPYLSRLERMRAGAQAALAKQLVRYKERHPKVIELRARLAAIDHEIALANGPTGTGRPLRPEAGTREDKRSLTELRVDLAGKRALLAQLKTRYKARHPRIRELEGDIEKLERIQRTRADRDSRRRGRFSALLRKEIDLLEKQLPDARGRAMAAGESAGPRMGIQIDLLDLKRQLASFNGDRDLLRELTLEEREFLGQELTALRRRQKSGGDGNLLAIQREILRLERQLVWLEQ